MKYVASLRYGVIFKKAFCDVEIFTQFVKDFTGIQLEIDQVVISGVGIIVYLWITF